MLEVTAVSSDARQESASERQNRAVDGVLGKIVPDRLKNCLQFSFVLGLGRVSLVLFEHGSPDMEIQRIKVGRIRRPLIFLDEVWTMLF